MKPTKPINLGVKHKTILRAREILSELKKKFFASEMVKANEEIFQFEWKAKSDTYAPFILCIDITVSVAGKKGTYTAELLYTTNRNELKSFIRWTDNTSNYAGCEYILNQYGEFEKRFMERMIFTIQPFINSHLQIEA